MGRQSLFETDEDKLKRLLAGRMQARSAQLSLNPEGTPGYDSLKQVSEDEAKELLRKQTAKDELDYAKSQWAQGKQVPSYSATPLAIPDMGGDLVRQALGMQPEQKSDLSSPLLGPVSPTTPKRAPAVVSAKPDKSQMVKEYIQKKYGFGDEDNSRMAYENSNSGQLAGALGAAASKAGAAIAGVKADTEGFDQISANADRGVKMVQGERQRKMDDVKYGQAQREIESQGREDDLTSDVTRTYQTLAKKMLPSKDFSQMSATQIKQVLPSIEKLYSIQENAALKQALLGAKSSKDAEAHTVRGRLDKLGAEGKQRLDNAMMAYRAVKDMRDALSAGDWTVKPIGENNFTDAKSRYIEGLGRMQSGGQIGGGEKATFAGFVPGPLHDAAMQKRKLDNAEMEMRRRIKTLGFDPEELDDEARNSPAPLAPVHDIDAIDAILKSRGEL